MANKKIIEEILKKMTFDLDKDEQFLKDEFIKNGLDLENILFILTENEYDESLCLYAIKVLILSNSVNINKEDGHKRNFIQRAICSGYTDSFISKLIEIVNDLGVKNSFDINHVDEDENSLLHNAIYYPAWQRDIAFLYKSVLSFGFNATIKDKFNRNIVEAMASENEKYDRFSSSQIEEVMLLFKKQINNKGLNNCDRSTIESSGQVFKNKIAAILDKMTGDVEEDIKIMRKECSCLYLYLREFLEIIVSSKYDEKKCYSAVYALLSSGFRPKLESKSLEQKAIISGYSENFILNILRKTNCVNYVDENGDTLLHTAIKSENFNGDLLNFYKELSSLNFDSCILDNAGRNLIQVVYDEQLQTRKFNNNQIECFKDFYLSEVARLRGNEKVDESLKLSSSDCERCGYSVENKKRLSEFSIIELEIYGKILNYKNFAVEPIIGRERELKNLMVSLAQDRKSPIIVGESGVGKTALVDELAYLIDNNKVPAFLKDKIIYEINPNELVAGCKYVGEFEKKLKEMFEVVLKYDVILFIDEIHTIYGVGSSENKSNGMEAYLKHFIDRNNIKIIGTTTEEEYQKYFVNDALKRRFEKIKVEEPDEKTLTLIIRKVIEDYCLRSNLKFKYEIEKEDIVEVIVSETNKKHRVYDDIVNNPDLAISIIDKAFAFAKYNDSEYISKDNFIDSFDYCDRLYESARNRAISKLKENKENAKIVNSKILKVDFSKFRR